MNIQFMFAYFDIYQFKTFKLLLFIVIALCNNIGLLYAQATKPNVIIMFMDDMGWGDLGCYGHPAEETPHLDQMANEGMRFTDWYSGSNICSPSRASLLTGRLPVRNGFYSTTQMARNSYSPQEVLGGIAESEVLLSEVLHESGYRTKIVGKWHLGHHERHLPLQHGFEEWFGAPNCHYKYDDVVIPNIPVYKNDKMTGRYYDDYKFDHETGEGNLTQLYVQEALDFIDAASNSASPFFLYWTPDATHTPLYASKSYRGRSQRGLYGDAVMEIDAGVGKIMGRLRKHKLDRNTFVFFSSDNGAATYAHEDGGSNGPFLCGKQTTFEGGYRQPALAWWPGQIKAGQVSHQVGNMMDLLPTIAGMAGAKLPADIKLDGIDLRHTLLNGTTEDRPTFYYRGDTLFHVRVGFYKAFYYSWGSPLFAQKFHYKYCPGQHVENITTEDMRDYTKHPVLFHLGKDPGEKYPIDSSTDEYHNAMIAINKAKDLHEKELIRAKPEFNMCDLAAQNWAPAGCEEIGRCMKIPPSAPYVCDWPY